LIQLPYNNTTTPLKMDSAVTMAKDKLAVLRQKLDQIPILQQAEVSRRFEKTEQFFYVDSPYGLYRDNLFFVSVND
jgi:hypothetical protein